MVLRHDISFMCCFVCGGGMWLCVVVVDVRGVKLQVICATIVCK